MVTEIIAKIITTIDDTVQMKSDSIDIIQPINKLSKALTKLLR